MREEEIKRILGKVKKILLKSKWGKEDCRMDFCEVDTLLRETEEGKTVIKLLEDAGITAEILEQKGFLYAALIFGRVLKEKKYRR
jgi:hypothetical protein